MTPARWQQINELFHAALKREQATRHMFLRTAAEGDPDLLREVETLLRSHENARGFLDEPAWGVAAELILGEPAASLTGRQLGPYRVVQEIGRGGMGVVYAAEDQRLGRMVALKALTPEYTRDPIRRARLAREARSTAAFSHPGIATVFALEEIDGELYIASEFVEGYTLREELQTGPLAVDRLLPSLIEIATALAAAHERGIVHRDLKPENVIRRTDGQLKVLDFGLASTTASSEAPSFTRLTEVGVALGTPGYMAPEQLGGGEVDARADVFAFGVLAWELATAEHPFGRDPAAALARMTELMGGGSASLSRSLPVAGLDGVVRRCMRAAPAERYPSAAALLADLRSVERGATRQPAGAFPLWWWQCHQLVVSALNASMTAAVWLIRQWMPRPYGSVIFLVALMLATVSVTLRLNLWFTSRVHPEMLDRHRARLFPAVLGADALLGTAWLAAAGLIAGPHDAPAALLVVVGAATFASLALIEPATTRQAGLDRPAARN
ncbi:MAG: serine/threonine protein kinase [Acidobacteriota bacterium]|nr:serine/threonine protein kinase [Acidobacteriota bacterium]